MSKRVTHILHCAVCDAVVSEPVSLEVEDDLPFRRPLKPAFPKGEGWVTMEPIPQSKWNECRDLLYTNYVFMSTESLAEDVADTPFKDRVRGCCGPSGIDGPNKVCKCGNHIGTESRDCWTAWEFKVDPTATYWEVLQ
ncbi:MAG: hypothetical protein WA989_09490 [Henriciella sp.]|uniref:hypothetical protein n=1 Tax=Henriciella sp. TaxID=1968823 RepID=UPI003C779CA5